jgi:hypothetical protein
MNSWFRGKKNAKTWRRLGLGKNADNINFQLDQFTWRIKPTHKAVQSLTKSGGMLVGTEAGKTNRESYSCGKIALPKIAL